MRNGGRRDGRNRVSFSRTCADRRPCHTRLVERLIIGDIVLKTCARKNVRQSAFRFAVKTLCLPTSTTDHSCACFFSMHDMSKSHPNIRRCCEKIRVTTMGGYAFFGRTVWLTASLRMIMLVTSAAVAQVLGIIDVVSPCPRETMAVKRSQDRPVLLVEVH